MNNEIHGLCSKCVQKFTFQPPPSINYQCQKCNESQSQLIQNDMVMCIKCYLKFKQSLSMMKKSQAKNTSSLILVPKGETTSSVTSFLSRNCKVIKKLEKLLTAYDLKSTNFLTELGKKTLMVLGQQNQNQTIWEKIVDKCSKTSSLAYIFVGKDLIFGGFITQSIKISTGTNDSYVEDLQSGLFLSERVKYDLNIYKTGKNVVKYSNKTKSIVFGEPPGFQVCFGGKEIAIKSQFEQQLKWEQLFIVKL